VVCLQHKRLRSPVRPALSRKWVSMTCLQDFELLGIERGRLVGRRDDVPPQTAPIPHVVRAETRVLPSDWGD
jgi:hypothetical protein